MRIQLMLCKFGFSPIIQTITGNVKSSPKLQNARYMLAENLNLIKCYKPDAGRQIIQFIF